MCDRSIPSVVNTLNRIHLNSNLFDKISRTLYNDKIYVFEYLFRIFIKLSFNEIYHPALLEEWKSNLDKVAYKSFGIWCWRTITEEINLS